MKNYFENIKLRIKENYKKNKKLCLLMFLVWFLVVAVTLYVYKDSLGKKSTGNEAFDNVVEINENTKVVEQLPVEDGAKTIAIKMATYARDNIGNIHVLVQGNKTKTVYADKNINVAFLQDNAFVTIKTEEDLNVNKDPIITVTITSDSKVDKGAGVYYSNDKIFENSKLVINNKNTEGDLSLRYLINSDSLMKFNNIVLTWVIISFTFILFLLLLVKPKYEILFLTIAFSFGMTFWLIITPMSVPDETIHYEYAFQLSNKIMGQKNYIMFNEEYQNYGAMAGHQNISAAYERFIEKINRPMNLKDTNIKMKFDIAESYTSCFVPQALGITLGRLLNFNMLKTFYLGRLFNLIFYLVCLYIAIKNTPVHKILFGIIATLPIFMQQAASFSYDCYINGLTFVIIAYLMKWLHEDKLIDKKDFIIAFLANMMIAPIKVVYGLFTLLYWFIPSSRFGSKRNKIIGALIICAPALYELGKLLLPLAFRIVRKIYEKTFAPSTVYADNFDLLTSHFDDGETYTFSDVLEDPIDMLIIFVRTVRYFLKTWFYGSFGRALSGNTLILPTWMVHSTLAILILSALRKEDYKASIWFSVAILVLCIFAGLMMVGGMLISWTEIDQTVIEAFGGPVIQGIQGRYFSPLLPYLFTILHNDKLQITKKIDKYLIYAFVLIVFEVVVYVLSYTFIN